MATVPGSTPDPSPLGRRHFPSRDHVSETRTTEHNETQSSKHTQKVYSGARNLTVQTICVKEQLTGRLID
jgi:hypothetical protein